ncbi:MAG: hypothetical protein JW843_01185 [Candidatus Aminicenantes bacterium]|nr:hypothetical protein [Candidatus Aminicenantes bacterium]
MFHKAGIAKGVGLGLMAFLVFTSVVSCEKKTAESEAALGEAVAQVTDAGLAIVVGLNTVDGTVKNAFGNYFFMDEVPGFDIVVNGPVQGELTGLIGKAVRVKGLFNKDLPNLLVAQSIEIKESDTQLTGVYSSADAAAPADFFNQKTRTEYPDLALTKFDKNADWEGKGKGKVFGIFLPGADDKPAHISVLGANGKEIGKVIVDSQTSFATFYMEKLKLFEKTWFYLNIKESVERRARTRNREMFHADLVFVGLY